MAYVATIALVVVLAFLVEAVVSRAWAQISHDAPFGAHNYVSKLNTVLGYMTAFEYVAVHTDGQKVGMLTRHDCRDIFRSEIAVAAKHRCLRSEYSFEPLPRTVFRKILWPIGRLLRNNAEYFHSKFPSFSVAAVFPFCVNLVLPRNVTSFRGRWRNEQESPLNAGQRFSVQAGLLPELLKFGNQNEQTYDCTRRNHTLKNMVKMGTYGGPHSRWWIGICLWIVSATFFSIGFGFSSRGRVLFAFGFIAAAFLCAVQAFNFLVG